MSMDGSGINFNSPFADMAILLGLNCWQYYFIWKQLCHRLVPGFLFVAVTGRVLRAMEENGHIPKFLGKINKSIISHVLPLHLMQLSAWLAHIVP